jgi:hypothetical protein
MVYENKAFVRCLVLHEVLRWSLHDDPGVLARGYTRVLSLSLCVV